MGVFTRPDSPWFYLYLEPIGKREPTDIPHGGSTAKQRREHREEAEAKYYERLKEIRQGKKAGSDLPPSTLAAFVPWYKEHILPTRRGRDVEEAILPRLVAAFGHLDLDDITPPVVKEWHTARLATPTDVPAKKRVKARKVTASPSWVNRETDVLKSILQAAVGKHIAASPLYGMKRLREKTPQRTILTEKHEAKLLAELAPDDAALVVLGMDSLVRMGDLLDIKHEHIVGRTVWIEDPKAGGGYRVALSKRAHDHLKKVPADPSGYVFARRRKPKTEHARRNGVKQMLQRACRRAGVPYGRAKGGITFHWATRRTGATRMLSRKIPLANVQKVGRWKSADVLLGIYHDLIDKDAHEAVNAVRPRSRSVPGTSKPAPKPKKKAG